MDFTSGCGASASTAGIGPVGGAETGAPHPVISDPQLAEVLAERNRLRRLADARGDALNEAFRIVSDELAHCDKTSRERDAAKALGSGDVDAACMIDSNHLAFLKEGTLPADGTRIVAQTQPFDHCNMTALDNAPAEPVARFVELDRKSTRLNSSH